MSLINEKKLYIGTNYHPHDWTYDRWVKDLNLMEKASMNIVRLGHLCWDSFEPEEGIFELNWLDTVMDLCNDRRISVFLDIPTRPAPTWLHRKYPSIGITDKNGIHQYAHTRYMEDVGSPHFQQYAYRLARVIASHFKNHPALIAFGLCNELGSGFISYSEESRKRFNFWLKRKYGTVDELNKVWSAKRWSRKESDFENIAFPVGSESIGAPERYLDMRRFFSDEIIRYIEGFRKVVATEAPDIKISANHWAEDPNIGFDYLNTYKKLYDFSGQGFYPGINPEDGEGIIGACFCTDHRMSEFDSYNWNLKFQTGSFGGYCSPEKAMRMYAYLTYLHDSQAILAWTWRSMLGGEEQYLFGLLDHDAEPSIKYDNINK